MKQQINKDPNMKKAKTIVKSISLSCACPKAPETIMMNNNKDLKISTTVKIAVVFAIGQMYGCITTGSGRRPLGTRWRIL